MSDGKPTALGMAKCIVRKSEQVVGHGYSTVEIEIAQAVIDLSAENARLRKEIKALKGESE